MVYIQFRLTDLFSYLRNSRLIITPKILTLWFVKVFQHDGLVLDNCFFKLVSVWADNARWSIKEHSNFCEVSISDKLLPKMQATCQTELELREFWREIKGLNGCCGELVHVWKRTRWNNRTVLRVSKQEYHRDIHRKRSYSVIVWNSKPHPVSFILIYHFCLVFAEACASLVQ